MQRPNISSLPKAEKERRWRQHQAARGNTVVPYQREATSNDPHPIAYALHTLPPCAIHYLQALEDPFGLLHEGHEKPCIPDLYAIPSKKVHALTRFTFSTGIDGNGFVLLCCQCKSNDVGNIIATTATAAFGPAIPSVTGALPAGVVPISELQLPYNTAAFPGTTTPGNSGIQGRVVGKAIRVKYAGVASLASGTMTAIRHPENEQFSDIPFTKLDTYETAKRTVIQPNGEWMYVAYRPVTPSEYQYSPFAGSDRENGPSAKWEIAIAIAETRGFNGTPAPAPFIGEVVSFIEYIGGAPLDSVTATHSDVSAMSAIRNVMSTKSATTRPHVQLVKQLTNLGTNVMKTAAPMVTESVKKSATHHVVNKLLLAHKSHNEALQPRSPGLYDTVMGGLRHFASSALTSVLGRGLGRTIANIGSKALTLAPMAIGALL